MDEVISKAILSGLGFASLARDAIRETAQELVKESKLSEEEGRRLVKTFQQRSAKAQRALEQKVHAAVHKALKHLNVAPAGPNGTRVARPGTKRTSPPPRRHTARAAVAR